MAKSFLILCASVLFFSSYSSWSLEVTGATGVSNFKKVGKSAVVYGGLAGPSCMSADRHLTCDSCGIVNTCITSSAEEQAPTCSCNVNRIYDSLIVRLDLGRRPGSHRAYAVASGGTSNGVWNFTPVTPNNRGQFVDFTWNEVCTRSAGASCEALPFNSGLKATVYIDMNDDGLFDSGDEAAEVIFKIVAPGRDQNVFGAPNLEGISRFSMWPGNGKIYLTDINTTTSFPYMSYGAQVSGIRVFTSEKSMDEAIPTKATITTDLLLDSDGNLKTDFIGALKNDTTYFSRLALVDEAGNLVQFFPAYKSLGNECTLTPSANCEYAGTPTSKSTTDARTMADLGRAIGTGDEKETARLLKKVKDVDQTFNRIGETPLSLAALNANVNIVKMILARHPNVNHQTTNGYSALMFAVLACRTPGAMPRAIEIVKILSAAGADKGLTNADGLTAKGLAIQGHFDELVPLL